MRYFFYSFFAIIAFALSLQAFAQQGGPIYTTSDPPGSFEPGRGSGAAEACAAIGCGNWWCASSNGSKCGAQGGTHGCDSGFCASSTSVGISGYCPAGMTFSDEHGECRTCPGEVINGQCASPNTVNCDIYSVLNITDGTDHPDGYTSTCVNHGGDCSDADEGFGNAYYDQDFSYCNSAKEKCEELGGTYGAIGSETGSQQVCLHNYGGDQPTCASGSQNWIENTDGSFAVACNSVEGPPNDVCDGSLYDCDGDGNVDDQDRDGCTDNGTSNGSCVGNSSGGSSSGGGGSGSGSGSGGGSGSGSSGGDGQNVGYDPLNPATKGAGDCDPTSQNYGECAGLGGGGNDAGYDENSPLMEGIDDINNNLGDIRTGIGNLNNTASEINDKIPETVTYGDFITEEPLDDSLVGFHSSISGAPIVQAAVNVAGAFSSGGECPAPTFDAFGQSFSLNYHCTLYSSISGILSSAMIAFWLLVGIRHIMSA
jgi:hypothetical protein